MRTSSSRELLQAKRSLETYWPAEVFFIICCSATRLADELRIFNTFSHLIYAIMLGKFTHMLLMITHLRYLQYQTELEEFCNKHSDMFKSCSIFISAFK